MRHLQRVLAATALLGVFAVLLAGCSTPPAQPLTVSQAETVARAYNVVPGGIATEFNGSVSLEYALYYFTVHNRLGSADCPAEYQAYAANTESGVLAKYEIPKEIVETYVQQYILAIDPSSSLGRFSVKDGCYVLFGSGNGGDASTYSIRDLQASETTTTFLCDRKAEKESEPFMTQKFTLQSDRGVWKLSAVQIVYVQEQSY